MDYSVTVCIPTYNATKTLAFCLDALKNQSLEMRVVIGDNGSVDGTWEMIQAAIANKHYPTNIEAKKFVHLDGDMCRNVPFMRYHLSRLVETKYTFFLDSDVIIPPNSIKMMIEDMENSPEIGMMGLRYEPTNNGHVLMGATILRTELAKKINWKWDEKGCDCNHAAEQIESMGFKAAWYNLTQARHLKYV